MHFLLKLKYTTLFFDLDRTLWDFETNSSIALRECLVNYELHSLVSDFKIFEQAYHTLNTELWQQYRFGKIEKSMLSWLRFHETFLMFGIDNQEMAKRFGHDYLASSQKKCGLMPFCIEILEYLLGKYRMFIITNGFEEVQHAKLENCGLGFYFNGMISSEMAGAQKPDRAIFKYALQMVGVSPSECLMIGDDYEADIVGAQQLGIDQVYYNFRNEKPSGPATFELSCLNDLRKIL